MRPSRPSIMRQIFRGSRVRQIRVRRGLGQTVAALSTVPSCTSWVPIGPSDPMWPTILPLIQGAGFGTTQPAPVVNDDYHFLFTLGSASIPQGSAFFGAVSPGQPAGVFYMKCNTVNSITQLDQLTVHACLQPATAAVSPTAAASAAAASSSLPYILAGIAGVVVVGGLIYYASE
jgi:hypothetical protein